MAFEPLLAHPNTPPKPLCATIFCKVVDNFGDAGICWRLAKHLSNEYHWSVTLCIDQIELIRALEPAFSSNEQLHVIPWTNSPTPPFASDILISCLDAKIPRALSAAPPFHNALGTKNPARTHCNGATHSLRPANDRRPSFRLHLEHLTAEPWVDRFHNLDAISPQNGEKTCFFFPGFTETSGGLLRESTLLVERKKFTPAAQQAWLAKHGVHHTLRGPMARGKQPHRLISLFCYPNAPQSELFSLLAADPVPSTVLIPTASADKVLERAFGGPLRIGEQRKIGQTTLVRMPFLTQVDYDRLLWCCDLNFVRGEDSWIRAHWAQRPFVWHTYPQSESTHLHKLEAFLSCAKFGSVVGDFMRAWSGAGNLSSAWEAFRADEPGLCEPFETFALKLSQQTSLVERLVARCHAGLCKTPA